MSNITNYVYIPYDELEIAKTDVSAEALGDLLKKVEKVISTGLYVQISNNKGEPEYAINGSHDVGRLEKGVNEERKAKNREEYKR